MIRLIVTAIFLLIFFIVSIPMHLVLWIISKFNKDASHIASMKIVGWALKVVYILAGAKVNVIGYDHIPTDEAVLFIGNHRSYFDIVCLYPIVKRRLGFISKKEFEKVPFLSTWMRFIDCLFLDRKDLRQGLQTILTAIEDVKNGISIAIYPEGTRKKEDDDELLPFHKGSFKIAQKSGCAIIPVTCNNTRDLFENNTFGLKSAKVTIEFGEPIYYKDLSKEDQKNIDDYVKNIIQKTYIKNKSL